MLHSRFILRLINGSGKQSLIFICCVALSLLTLTSLGGFSNSVRQSMLKDARQLHASDIKIHSHYPLSLPLTQALSRYEDQGLIEGALVNRFYSMASSSDRQKSILSDLKIVEPGYPFYGRVILASGRDFSRVLTRGSVIVDQVLLDRLQAEVGDTVHIGSASLTISDIVLVEPDRPVSFFSFGPRVFISASDLDEIDLIKKGSRIQYDYLIKVHEPDMIDRLARELSAAAMDRQENVDTYRTANSRVKRFFENFLFFLNLTGIFTLLLAGIGIQASLSALLRENRYTLAIMKSVGATSVFIILHFMIMVMLLGAAGTLLGLLASFILQLYLPTLFAGILPAHVTLAISWPAVFEGLVLGAIVVALFSYLPLCRTRNLKPAYIFRKDTDPEKNNIHRFGAIVIIAFFFVILTIWQLEDVRTGIYFMLGLSGLIGLTTFLTQGVLLALRKHSPGSLDLRQAFRGLFRPNNATRAIIITLSASLSVIFSIYLIDRNLSATFIDSYPPNLPNAYFLDIQPEQKKEFAGLLPADADFYPIIRARLVSINDRKINRRKELEKKRDNLAREFNLTYREHLLGDEQMLVGETLFGSDQKEIAGRGEVPVSVLDTVAEFGNIKVGDLLVFRIQGLPLRARVTSMRTRTESKVRPFFYFVFQDKVFKDAPQTIFSAARIDRQDLTEIQTFLAGRFPNISVIDIGSTIKVLSRIMHKMSSIIQFFTSFSILAGVLIIISSVYATRLTRVREAVYFKVLGAKTRFVTRVFTYENMIIALTCSLLASLISHIGSWLVCRHVFSIEYAVYLSATIGMVLMTLLLVVAVGLGASVTILRQKPITFLRDDDKE